MGFGIKVVEHPADEPVSLTEFKAHARVLHDDEDAYFRNILIPAARSWCEKHTGRAFVTQTLRMTFDCFPEYFELLRPPLQEVESITYVAVDEDTETMDDADYRAETDNEPGIVTPAYGTTWPETLDVPGAVKVTYVAGYGDPNDVPAPIKQAILMLACHWNMNREAVSVGPMTKELEFSVTALLSPYWTGLYCPDGE